MNSIYLNAQVIAEYTVSYDFICISDTSEYTYFQPEEYTLLCIGNESRFMPENQFYNDSILAEFDNAHPLPPKKTQEALQNYLDLYSQQVAPKPLRSEYMIRKDFETSKFISILYWSFRKSYMEESMDLDWKIINEKDSILGLPCIAAKTYYGGRKYKAWFTTQVPISDGPYVFQGLPGLILKLQDDQKWYTFVATSINTEHSERYVRDNFVDKLASKIDRETFIEKMKEKKNNPRFPMGMLNITEEQKLALKKRFGKRFDLLIEKS